MLCLIVPILISYLREADELETCSNHCKTLHEYSLQWLMKVGPKYQQVIYMIRAFQKLIQWKKFQSNNFYQKLNQLIIVFYFFLFVAQK